MAKQTIFLDDTFLDHIGEEEAWFLGLMASDGCIKNDKRATISQSGPHGRETLEYCKVLLKHTGVVRHTHPKGGDVAHSLYLPSTRLVARLAEFGVIRRKTLVYQFPTELPLDQLASYARGYIDGDGCVGAYRVGGSEHYLKIGLFGNPGFITTLNELVPVRGKTSLQSKGMQIWWNGSKAVEFGQWVFESDNLFKSKKYRTFWAEVPRQERGRVAQWRLLKPQILARLDEGETPMSIAKSLEIPYQTVYKYRANRV